MFQKLRIAAASLLSSFLLLFYLAYFLLAGLRYLPPVRVLPVWNGSWGSFALTAGICLIFTAFLFSAGRLAGLFKPKGAGRFTGFIISSFVFCLSVYAGRLLILKVHLEGSMAALIILQLILISGLCIFFIMNFVYNHIFYLFGLLPLSEKSAPASRGILRESDFYKKAADNFNQSLRLGQLPGFLLVRTDDFRVTGSDRQDKDRPFLRKQFLFLLSGHSRTYEPWSRSADKGVWFSCLQIRDREEAEAVLARYRDLFRTYEFMVFNTPVRPSLKYLLWIPAKNSPLFSRPGGVREQELSNYLAELQRAVKEQNDEVAVMETEFRG